MSGDVSNTPMVSVGLPVYNGEAYLRQSLDSLLAQDYQDFEIVLSDNASTDGTPRICQEYASRDRRVISHRNSENVGPIRNFVRVLELARGPHFMWAGHDDLWSKNYISAMVSCFDANHGLALAAAKTVYIDELGNLIDRASASAPPRRAAGPIQTVDQYLSAQATSWIYGMFDREVLRAVMPRFDRFRIVKGSDVVFMSEFCLQHSVAGDDNAIIYKRLAGARDWAPRTPRQKVGWQVEFTRLLLGTVATAGLSLADRARLLRIYFPYLRRFAFRGGPRRVGLTWLRASSQWCRGLDRV
ncbi:MAG: glycosyltransferase [Isosphaeraceae bacterium]